MILFLSMYLVFFVLAALFLLLLKTEALDVSAKSTLQFVVLDIKVILIESKYPKHILLKFDNKSTGLRLQVWCTPGWGA